MTARRGRPPLAIDLSGSTERRVIDAYAARGILWISDELHVSKPRIRKILRAAGIAIRGWGRRATIDERNPA